MDKALELKFKDPDERIDFKFDWGSKRLALGETISESEFLITSPDYEDIDELDALIIDAETGTDTYKVAWTLNGVLWSVYKLTNRVTTSTGRVMDWTIRIKIQPK